MKDLIKSQLTDKQLTKKQKKELEILRRLNEGDPLVVSSIGLGQGKVAQGGENFEELFNESSKEHSVKVGDIVQGLVLEVQSDYVLVDINYKSEGLIPISEFRGSGNTVSFHPGDSVDVYVDRIENENGMVVLSKEKADMNRAWLDISKAAENQDYVEGRVLSKVKGGLSVDIGVKAFLPGSQIDLRPVKDLDPYVGNQYKFKVIKFNKKRGNIVLSRRALLEDERQSLRSQTKDQMKEGSRVKGFVKNVTDYGAFVDLGGIDGLLHITDMSWSRIKHPTDVIKVGEELEVVILKYDASKERVSLGLKQLTEDPWSHMMSKFPVGSRIKGSVVSLTDYGAFIDLGEGVEGLIHISEMSWTKRIKKASNFLSVGEEVEVEVLSLDQDNRRISLGMKQLQPNPWNEFKEAYPPGTVIEGEVCSVTEFGIFVSVADGVDGMVHVSDFSWVKRFNHPSELFKKGDKAKAVVLNVDVENEKFSLGIKQLTPDPWLSVKDKYTIGSIHEVEVSRIADFGVFVHLVSKVEGLVHISELSTQRVDNAEDFCKVGDTIKVEVISIDREAHKVGLSARLAALREKGEEVSEHLRKSQKPNTQIGDVFSDELNAIHSEGPKKVQDSSNSSQGSQESQDKSAAAGSGVDQEEAPSSKD